MIEKLYKIPVVYCMLTILSCNHPTANPDNITVMHKSDKPAAGISPVSNAGWPASFGFGHKADKALIKKWDIDVRPDGKGLPPGGGNAVAGSTLYLTKCVACHGGSIIPSGIKLPGPPLVNNPDSPRIKTIGNYWPYATTIFDYVRRTMPYNAPGSLTDNEVYAVTAWLLHANKLIDSTVIINAHSLPAIVMPAKKMFVADNRQGGKEVK